MGGVDACIDFVGVPNTMNLCIASIKRHGKVVQVGMYNGILQFPLFLMAENSVCIEGSLTGSLEDFKEMMALARAGKILTGRQIPVQKRHISQLRQTLSDMHERKYVGRIVLTHD